MQYLYRNDDMNAKTDAMFQKKLFKCTLSQREVGEYMKKLVEFLRIFNVCF